MRILKNIAYFIFLVILVASGWFMRGVMPGSSPMGDAPDMSGPGGSAPTPEVVTSAVTEVSKTPMKDYVGHIKAIQDVKIYAQISGTIQRVHFKEGSLVKQETLLFTIDPRMYRAEVQVEEAAVMQSQAKLEIARADLRYAELYMNRLANVEARSVVQADVDKAKSELLSAQASVQQSKAECEQALADLELARINLDYTQIRAPIDGKIGKAELTQGDYVSPGSGMLAQIVQVDPIRVRFSLSDRDYFSLAGGNEMSKQDIQLQLPNGNLFSGIGAIDFFGNKMNPETGTMTVYARFSNMEGFLVPGTYVTVHMSSTPDYKTWPVVSQLSVMTDNNGEYVYVLNEEGAVEKRQVQLGDLTGENRIVLSGLTAGERVVVKGVQKVKPGQKVRIDMPSSPKEPQL